VSVSHSGATQKYSENWQRAFGGRRSSTPSELKPKKTVAPVQKRIPKIAGQKAKVRT